MGRPLPPPPPQEGHWEKGSPSGRAWTLHCDGGKSPAGSQGLGKGAFCINTESLGASRGPEQPPPHLSLLLSAVISRPIASLLSVASSSSRWSFLRLALIRCDSSSASSSCLLSCLTFVFPFSACQGEAQGQGVLGCQGRVGGSWRPWGAGRGPGVLGGQGACGGHIPAPCTARPPCARPPPVAGLPLASCLSASGTWQPPVSLCAHGGRRRMASCAVSM